MSGEVYVLTTRRLRWAASLPLEANDNVTADEAAYNRLIVRQFLDVFAAVMEKTPALEGVEVDV